MSAQVGRVQNIQTSVQRKIEQANWKDRQIKIITKKGDKTEKTISPIESKGWLALKIVGGLALTGVALYTASKFWNTPIVNSDLVPNDENTCPKRGFWDLNANSSAPIPAQATAESIVAKLNDENTCLKSDFWDVNAHSTEPLINKKPFIENQVAKSNFSIPLTTIEKVQGLLSVFHDFQPDIPTTFILLGLGTFGYKALLEERGGRSPGVDSKTDEGGGDFFQKNITSSQGIDFSSDVRDYDTTDGIIHKFSDRYEQKVSLHFGGTTYPTVSFSKAIHNLTKAFKFRGYKLQEPVRTRTSTKKTIKQRDGSQTKLEGSRNQFRDVRHALQYLLDLQLVPMVHGMLKLNETHWVMDDRINLEIIILSHDLSSWDLPIELELRYNVVPAGPELEIIPENSITRLRVRVKINPARGSRGPCTLEITKKDIERPIEHARPTGEHTTPTGFRNPEGTECGLNASMAMLLAIPEIEAVMLSHENPDVQLIAYDHRRGGGPLTLGPILHPLFSLRNPDMLSRVLAGGNSQSQDAQDYRGQIQEAVLPSAVFPLHISARLSSLPVDQNVREVELNERFELEGVGFPALQLLEGASLQKAFRNTLNNPDPTLPSIIYPSNLPPYLILTMSRDPTNQLPYPISLEGGSSNITIPADSIHHGTAPVDYELMGFTQHTGGNHWIAFTRQVGFENGQRFDRFYRHDDEDVLVISEREFLKQAGRMESGVFRKKELNNTINATL